MLVVSPEITSGHLNWRDRDSHFIFGDVATAVLVEDAALAPAAHWDILGTRLKTVFSNNIRNNFGFLNRATPETAGTADKLFVQEGRKVFKEVVPMVAQMIIDEAARLGIEVAPEEGAGAAGLGIGVSLGLCVCGAAGRDAPGAGGDGVR